MFDTYEDSDTLVNLIERLIETKIREMFDKHERKYHSGDEVYSREWDIREIKDKMRDMFRKS
jgi:hypothetical protein